MSLQAEDELQISCLHPVAQETVITDLLKTGREHMHKIAAYEFLIGKADGTPWLSGSPASGREGGVCSSYREDTAVGDRNLMRISTKVLDGIAKAVKGLFDIGAPVLFVEGITEFIPGI